jgi:hypothetical protein
LLGISTVAFAGRVDDDGDGEIFNNFVTNGRFLILLGIPTEAFVFVGCVDDDGEIFNNFVTNGTV